MKKMMIVNLIILLVCLYVAADEIEEMKVEIQELKEKVTRLNNRLLRIAEDGRGLSIGIPTGLYNGDHVYGAEIGYFFRNRLGVRMDVHFLGEYDGEEYLLVALPALGILGKSPVFYNFTTYGGVLIGLSEELTGEQRGPFLHSRGFAGIEFFTSSKVGFFIECGGGGIFSDTDVTYARGTLISGGTRIYF